MAMLNSQRVYFDWQSSQEVNPRTCWRQTSKNKLAKVAIFFDKNSIITVPSTWFLRKAHISANTIQQLPWKPVEN